MEQIARCNPIDVGEPSVRVCPQIETTKQFQQSIVGAVRDRYRQGLFIESLYIATDKVAQQPIQAPMAGLFGAQVFKFLLESPEGSQPVMLVRKPGK